MLPVKTNNNKGNFTKKGNGAFKFYYVVRDEMSKYSRAPGGLAVCNMCKISDAMDAAEGSNSQ